MTIRILLVISLTALLFGCSSDKVKDDAPAAVEDLTSQQANAGGTEDSNAQAYGTDDSSTSGFSQLDDPQSPLSVRVIYFEYDSSEIRSEYRSAIEAHAAYLSQNADTTDYPGRACRRTWFTRIQPGSWRTPCTIYQTADVDTGRLVKPD